MGFCRFLNSGVIGKSYKLLHGDHGFFLYCITEFEILVLKCSVFFSASLYLRIVEILLWILYVQRDSKFFGFCWDPISRSHILWTPMPFKG